MMAPAAVGCRRLFAGVFEWHQEAVEFVGRQTKVGCRVLIHLKVVRDPAHLVSAAKVAKNPVPLPAAQVAWLLNDGLCDEIWGVRLAIKMMDDTLNVTSDEIRATHSGAVNELGCVVASQRQGGRISPTGLENLLNVSRHWLGSF